MGLDLGVICVFKEIIGQVDAGDICRFAVMGEWRKSVVMVFLYVATIGHCYCEAVTVIMLSCAFPSRRRC